MKSLKKRIFTTALAGTMALSMAATAFAAEGDSTGEGAGEEAANNTETKITATYTAPTIAVTVPATTTAAINPLGLPVKIGENSDTNTDYELVGHEIATAPVAIVNNSSTDLTVGATVTTTVAGNLKLLASADSIDGKDAVGNEEDEDYQPAVPKTTANSAFVYLQLKSGKVAPSGTDPDDIESVVMATATDSTWSTTYSAASDIVLNATKAQSKDDIITLTKATFTDGDVSAYTKSSLAVVRLAGRVVKTPKTPWASSDGFTTTVAFTFSPA